MALNEIDIDADVDSVWQVLADPDSYKFWVVGANDIRDWEGDWPRPGSLFHHSQGLGPITVAKDNTEVLESEAPRRLLLEVRVRPWLVAHVELVMEPRGEGGSHVRMHERPVGGILGDTVAPLLEPLIKGRNVKSLDRLRALSEQRFRGRSDAPAVVA